MVNSFLRPLAAATVALLLFIPTRALAQEERRVWAVEAGALAGYHSNFFFRGEGVPAPSTTLFNLFVNGEGEFRKPSGRYTVLFDAGAVRTGDISNGNHFSLLGGLEYRRGANRLTGELFLLPNRVYDDEGDGSFFDTVGTAFEYRRVLGPGLWVRANYEIELWRFDPDLSNRNSTTHDLNGSFRFPINERLGVRTTVYYGARSAEDPRYNFASLGVAGAIEAQPTDVVNLFVRYRIRSRDYNDVTDDDDSNFMRGDTVHDFVVNLRWEVSDRWGLRFENFFRRGSSTREDRNYSGNRFLAGAFVMF